MKIQIEADKVYEITIGKNRTTVKVLKVERRVNGQLVYDCLNVKSGKRTTVSDSKRFLREIKTEKPVKAANVAKEKAEHPEGKKVSGLDAAHKVLVESGRPMRVKEIAEIALQNDYCKLKGATPEFTISSAIQREIKAKGDASRFVKAERGLFAAR